MTREAGKVRAQNAALSLGFALAFCLALSGPGWAQAAPEATGFVRPDTLGDEPLVGDWDGDGTQTIGVFRTDTPAGTNTFFLRNSNNPGVGDIVIESIGAAGDLPIVGDWNGNGTTTVGLFRPNSPPGSNTFFLWNSNSNPPGPPDIIIEGLGAAGDLPIAGDWDGNGTTTIGLFRPNEPAGTNTFFLLNTHVLGPPDITFVGFGGVGDMPRAGGYVHDPAVVEAATLSANGMVVSTLTFTESAAAADSRL